MKVFLDKTTKFNIFFFLFFFRLLLFILFSLDDLWSRYETPDEKNRWDSPLFRVDTGHGTEDHSGDTMDRNNDITTPRIIKSSFTRAGNKNKSLNTNIPQSESLNSSTTDISDTLSNISITKENPIIKPLPKDETSTDSSTETTAPPVATLVAITEALYHKRGLTPVFATLPHTSAEPDYLYAHY